MGTQQLAERLVEIVNIQKGEQMAILCLLTAIARALPPDVLGPALDGLGSELATARQVLQDQDAGEDVFSGFDRMATSIEGLCSVD